MSSRITGLRHAKGWSMADLARAAGTTKGQIQKLERGDRRLTFDWMAKLAGAMGVKMSALLPPEEVECPNNSAETEILRFVSEIPMAEKMPFLRIARELLRLIASAAGDNFLSVLSGSTELNSQLISTWAGLSQEERKWALSMMQLARQYPSTGTEGP